MSEVEALYQDIILDHYKHPRGRVLLASPAGEAHRQPLRAQPTELRAAARSRRRPSRRQEP